MPTPGKNEKREDWLKRCIPQLIDEGRKQDQAVAICMDMWRRRKEVDVEEKHAVEYRPYGGATSFVELDEQEAARKTAYEVEELTWQFNDLVRNIMTSDIEDKAAAIDSLTAEFTGRLEELPKTKSFWDSVKELFKKKDKHKEEDRFMVYKEGDQWRWLVVFTNKFRDKDNPPEILAEKSHQGFVDAVDAGEWPYPMLRLWHVKGTESGAADFVAYDDKGFTIAGGTIDDEEVAVALSEDDDLAVSHGMPILEIERDKEDPTVITRYRTSEI